MTSERADEAVAHIIDETGNDRVELLVGDVSSIEGIDALALALAERVNHIDVLVNNAGYTGSAPASSDDGLGMHFAVNVLAPWRLTLALLPVLRAADDARVLKGAEAASHEIGMISTGVAEMGFDTSIFRTDAPAFEDILAVRAERQQMVTDFLAATLGLLAEERDNPWGGGDWHPTVGDCVRVILEEEWAHLRYVRRDLALIG